ncbi:MAG TPA: hypothetical protein VGP63_13545 [Planctomycetaceae bacterium]|nr:hypothetical protein [Planctomycetaceae bacterium]
MRTASRFRPSLLVLAVCVATFGGLVAIAYSGGRRLESEMRFLDQGRAPTSDEAFAACPIEYALHSTEANDVVFLGDSVCRYGIDPDQLQRLSGLKAFNLGSFGFMGPSGYAVTAKTYFANHPRPRAVVLCVSAVSFDVDPETGGGSIPKRFEDAYGGTMPRFDSIAKSGVRRLGNWFSGTDVRDSALIGMEGDTYRTFKKRWIESRGYFGLPGVHGKAHLVEAFAAEKLIRDDWNCGVCRLADECAAVDVMLVIRFCPLSTEFKGAGYSPVERWADEFAAAHPRAVVTRPTLLWYDPSLSWDRVHLNAAGVAKFMPVVAKDVQAALKK